MQYRSEQWNNYDIPPSVVVDDIEAGHNIHGTQVEWHRLTNKGNDVHKTSDSFSKEITISQTRCY